MKVLNFKLYLNYMLSKKKIVKIIFPHKLHAKKGNCWILQKGYIHASLTQKYTIYLAD